MLIYEREMEKNGWESIIDENGGKVYIKRDPEKGVVYTAISQRERGIICWEDFEKVINSAECPCYICVDGIFDSVSFVNPNTIAVACSLCGAELAAQDLRKLEN